VEDGEWEERREDEGGGGGCGGAVGIDGWSWHVIDVEDVGVLIWISNGYMLETVRVSSSLSAIHPFDLMWRIEHFSRFTDSLISFNNLRISDKELTMLDLLSSIRKTSSKYATQFGNGEEGEGDEEEDDDDELNDR